MAKCLKAKKLYCVFHTPKKKCFSMHFGFNNQFIKVKRTLTKISKKTKFFFILFISEHPGYDITRNAYSGYLIRFLFGQ